MIRRKVDPPRGVLNATPTHRGLRHERYHPSPDLELYVEHYWVVEWDLGQRLHRAETLPHPSVHLIFEPDGRSRIRGAARAKFSRALRGRGGVFAVKFTPAGFHPFAGVPVSRFTDRSVGVRSVFGTDGDSVDRAVLRARTDEARIAVAERFLRARRPDPDANVRHVNELVYAVANDHSILRVDDLVDRFGVNKRTLQRLFARYAGVSPKWVIQRYRLHEAAERLGAGDAPNHAALALQLGYSDQAPFVRDFKAIVGLSPAAYTRAARAKAG